MLALLLLAFVARLAPGQRIIDDAYITYRYARNLAGGAGFVYNPGEYVLGTTTPLYTVLLALLSLATGTQSFASISVVINAAAGTLSVGLLYALGRKFTSHRAPAFVAALLWAIAPYSVTFAVGGMETDLAIALLLAAALSHLSGRPYALAVLSALALMTRPDTGILLGLLWLDLFRVHRRLPWRAALMGLAVITPWLVFGTLTFGSPLTTSVSAKADAYLLGAEEGLVRLLQHYATPFFEQRLLSPALVVVVFALYCGLSVVATRRAASHDRRSWPIAAYPIIYFALFAIANPLIFRWYLSPPLPFYFLLIAGGVWTVAGDLARALARRRTGRPQHRLQPALLTLFAMAALGSTLSAWELHPGHGPDRPAPEMAWFELELLYGQAADSVLADAQPGATLCAGDIGVLGFRTDLHIVDTVGLVTSESSDHYPADPAIYVTNYAIPADLVAALDPDYIVILEVYGRLGLIPDAGFQSNYQLLERINTDIYGSEGMLVFGRASASGDPDPANKPGQ